MPSRFLAAVTVAAALTACAGDPPRRSAQLSGPRVAQAADPCPTQVDDARVRSEIIDGGAALVFYATDSAQIGEVRARVHALADQNLAGTPDVAVSVYDTPDGARLELRPRDQDPDRLGELRDRIADSADAMDGGECTVRIGAR